MERRSTSIPKSNPNSNALRQDQPEFAGRKSLNQGAEILIKPKERMGTRNLGPHPCTMARMRPINVRLSAALRTDADRSAMAPSIGGNRMESPF